MVQCRSHIQFGSGVAESTPVVTIVEYGGSLSAILFPFFFESTRNTCLIFIEEGAQTITRKHKSAETHAHHLPPPRPTLSLHLASLLS
jgi:hypothetical protein